MPTTSSWRATPTTSSASPATPTRAAYEARLEAAARAGALQLVQAVDAAYEVLRDPRRRAAYDSWGVVTAVPRLPPDQRFAPPVRVPFRQWTPAEPASSRWRNTRSGQR